MRCPVCAARLGTTDVVMTLGGGDEVAGCCRCLGLGQVEADGQVLAGATGEVLGPGAWYYKVRRTGQPVCAEETVHTWEAVEWLAGV